MGDAKALQRQVNASMPTPPSNRSQLFAVLELSASLIFLCPLVLSLPDLPYLEVLTR